MHKWLLQDPPHIVIGGLGLIGGSLSACFSEQGLQVTGVDRQMTVLNQAKTHGFIQLAFQDLFNAVADAAHSNASIWVFLCGPLSVNRAWLTQISVGLPSHVYVTDVGSCKRHIVALGQSVLPRQFIGGHPLTGKAVGGLDHALPLLFQQRPYVLCPNPDLPPAAMDQLHQLIALTGSRLTTLDADTHDRMMAWVSHVPQLYSYALANSLKTQWHDTPLIHGPALTEHLRLSTSPLSIWDDIFAENHDYITLAMQSMVSHANELLKPYLPAEPNSGNDYA